MQTGFPPSVIRPAFAASTPRVRFASSSNEKSNELEATGSQHNFYPPVPNRAVKKVVHGMAKTVASGMRFSVEMPEDHRVRLEELKARKDVQRLFLPNHPTGFLDLLTEEMLGLGALRMGAVDVIFEPTSGPIAMVPGMKKVTSRLFQRTGTFSVDRSSAEKSVETAIDVIAKGNDLTIFMEGFVTRTSDRIDKENIKPGPVKIAMGVVEKGKDVLLVPLAFSFETNGDEAKILDSLNSVMTGLEEKVGKEVGRDLHTENTGLATRMENLISVMVDERQKAYGENFGLDFSDVQGENTYARLGALREQVLDALEAKYDSHTSGGDERRARKLRSKIKLVQYAQQAAEQAELEKTQNKGKLAKLFHNALKKGKEIPQPKVQSEEEQVRLDELRAKLGEQEGGLENFRGDWNAANDMLNLSMYPADYVTNKNLPRMIETYAKLERDLHDKKGGMLAKVSGWEKRLRFFRRAQIVSRVRVGEPLNMRKLIESHPGMDQRAMIDHALAHLQTQVQANLE